MIVIKLRYITINIQRFENSISTINLYHFLINFFALIIEILKMYCEHFVELIKSNIFDVK